MTLGERETEPGDAPWSAQEHGDFGPRYRSLRRIGSGGMADVYEVEHVRLGARFAAKVLRRGRESWQTAARRFLREARLLAQLRSDHIVRVVDVSDDEQRAPFYVMELLDGVDVRELLRRSGALDVARAARLVRDACAGVGVAHAAGLVHRDLKPENLFITHRDDGTELCKLLDFGVSKGTSPATTETGTLVGTVAYMAPEQVESAGTVTVSADVYALGAILYELLTGRAPYVADTVERLLFKILAGELEAPSTLRRELPPELEAVVLRALARRADARFESVGALGDALEPFLDAPANATAALVPRGRLHASTPKRPPPRRALAGLGAAAAAALFAGGVLVGIRSRAPEASGPPPSPSAAPADVAVVRTLAPGQSSVAAVTTLTAPLEPPVPSAVAAAAPSSTPQAQPPNPQAPATPKRRPDRAAASAPAGKSAADAPLPKIQFELQNPYAH